VAHPELNAGVGSSKEAAPDADFAAAYQTATESVGVRVIGDRQVVRVIGDDRVSFLHGMCSADVKGAAPGAILPALFLTEHAHLIADLFIYVTNDDLLLEIELAAWQRARAHLERLLVADDVEFAETSLAVIDIEGPLARDAAAAVAGEDNADLNDWSHLLVNDLLAGNLPRLGGPAFSILAPPDRVEEVVARALATIPGAATIDEKVVEAIRIENGIARLGVDTNEKTLALEARLERAISFSKGCYLGQETVERATARGGLKKKLFALKFPAGKVPAIGTALKLGGVEVGKVTSAAISPRLGAIGLAILHRSAWQPGTTLSLDGEAGSALVCEIPLSAAD
jgi:folate-binding protein YgfZ